MYNVALKRKKSDKAYLVKKDLFFYTPEKVEKNTLRLFISHKIVVNLSRDMEKMMSLMVKSILEGVSDGER